MKTRNALTEAPTFRCDVEPDIEPMTGWPLVLVWAGLFLGSWAITIALAWAVVRVIVAVIRWILLFFGG